MGAGLDTFPRALREPTERWLDRFGEGGPVTDLARVAACSEFAGAVALREKDWLIDNVATFDSAPDPRHLDAFVEKIAHSDAGSGEIQSQLRKYRNRYLLHVIWRQVQALPAR